MCAENNDLFRSPPLADDVRDLHAIRRKHMAFDRESQCLKLLFVIVCSREKALRPVADAATADVSGDVAHVIAQPSADRGLIRGKGWQWAGEGPARKGSNVGDHA